MPRPTRLAAGLVLSLTLTACRGADGSVPPQEAAPRPDRGLPPVEVETGVVHVHGLGVDPGDGALYAATHSGLFRIPERGPAERIANRAQDTMGFSVVGPGQFIGSGHPDPREDDIRPPLLGLIESKDAGVSWERISLHGVADFHALAAAHGQVYGYDATSGTFMVSVDKRTWDRRSQLAMIGFAVDPADPEVLVATTPRGPVRSSDGGRTWALLAGAPPLALVAWQQDGGLFGATEDGAVHRSGDGGRTWQTTGSVGGRPEALAVDAAGGAAVRVHAAVADRGIVVSTDGGRSFTIRYADAAGSSP